MWLNKKCTYYSYSIWYIFFSIWFVILILSVFWCCHWAKEEIKNNRIQRRVYELLSKAATTGHSYPRSGQRELHFVFFRKPDIFLDSDERRGHVSGVRFEKTVLKGSKPSCVLQCIEVAILLCSTEHTIVDSIRKPTSYVPFFIITDGLFWMVLENWSFPKLPSISSLSKFCGYYCIIQFSM